MCRGLGCPAARSLTPALPEPLAAAPGRRRSRWVPPHGWLCRPHGCPEQPRRGLALWHPPQDVEDEPRPIAGVCCPAQGRPAPPHLPGRGVPGTLRAGGGEELGPRVHLAGAAHLAQAAGACDSHLQVSGLGKRSGPQFTFRGRFLVGGALDRVFILALRLLPVRAWQGS